MTHRPKPRRALAALIGIALTLSGCGGGDGGGTTSAATGGGQAVTGTGTAAGCTVLDRQNWVAAQLNEWYLFPETLPASLSPAGYATVPDYLNALTATARSQGRDRYFTYLTSIASENAYYSDGTSAGFGFRLTVDAANGRAVVAEAFEGTAALAAGIDRGTQITAIGTSAADLRAVSAIIAAEGTAGVTAALGDNNAGVTRLLRVVDAGGATRDVSLTKTSYSLLPVSTRYGAKIITEGGRRFGYINLRTFITPAETALRQATAMFAAQGVTDVIVDLRYNGGGLISTSELFGDLLGGGRSASDVFDYTTFRPEKAARNTQHNFTPQPQSIAPTRLAFIGTVATASASELLINAFTPFLHGSSALIGTNTYGKPVGQIALDRPECDDRLRVITFATTNGARAGEYFSGLASKVEANCQAADDLFHPLGDPAEASTRAALDFLQGKSCTPIATGQSVQRVAASRQDLLTPERPDTVQREVPGAF